MGDSALTRFQDAFARDLFAPEHGRAAAFSVYRNTVMKGCIDALQANYPAIARLAGEEWFRAAAAEFVRVQPPRVPMLLEYGEGFAGFLSDFAPAAELPYLPAVATLDRFWTEAHGARDEAPLQAAALAGLDPASLGARRLRPHAAARWARFPLPAYSIWSRNRQDPVPGEDATDIDWREEGALLTRPSGAVQWDALDAPGCAFLDGCAAGWPLAACAEAALRERPDADLAGLMARLLAAGAFSDSSEMEQKP